MRSKAPDATVPLHEVLAEVLARDPAAGGFDVYYQPIVRFAGQRTVAVEALPSWQHPYVGTVAPTQFVAAAERTGLSAVLDDFVLNQACADADALTAAYGLEVPVHVNIAKSRLIRPDLLHAAVEWALRRYKLSASRLVLEVADAGSVEDMGAAAKSLQRIRKLGVHVALDNFGLGYDVMARLQALPIDQVKLDATVTGAGVDARTDAMCQAVLDICRRIGLSVIAQGITTARQASVLQGMGCELGQGHLYGPPLRLQRIPRARLRTRT